jgi:hypothetical protein
MQLQTGTQTFYPGPLYLNVSNLLPLPFMAGLNRSFRNPGRKKEGKTDCIEGRQGDIFPNPSICMEEG